MDDLIAKLRQRVGSGERAVAVLGGEPVFPNGRLAVRHVGEMLLRGASRDEVREDYPYLEAIDIDFAVRFVLDGQR